MDPSIHRTYNVHSQQTHWLVQLSKSVVLAASSIGMAWVMGRFWHGSEADSKTSDLTDRVTIISGSDCALALTLGASHSLLSANPLPFAAGASLCLPYANADSTLPKNLPLHPHNHALESILTFVVDPQLCNQSSIIRFSTHKRMQQLRSEITSDSNLVIDPILERLNSSNQVILKFQDRLIRYNNSGEVSFVKAYLERTRQFLGEMIEVQESFLLSLGKRKTGRHNGVEILSKYIKPLNDRFKKFGEHLENLLYLLKENSQSSLSQIEHPTKEINESFQKISNLYMRMRSKKLEKNETGSVPEPFSDLAIELFGEADKLTDTAIRWKWSTWKLKEQLQTFVSDREGKKMIGLLNSVKKTLQADSKTLVGFNGKLLGIVRGIEIATLRLRLDNLSLAQQFRTFGIEALRLAQSIGTLTNVGQGSITPKQAIQESLYSIFISLRDFDIKLTNETVLVKKFCQTLSQLYHKVIGNLFANLPQLHQEAIIHFVLENDPSRHIPWIKSQIDGFEKRIDSKFNQLYQRLYSEVRKTAIGNPKAEYFELFGRWAKEGVVNPIVTETKDDLVKGMQEHGIDFNIQSIARIAKTHIKDIECCHLPNPLLWVDAVNVCLDYLWNTPQFVIEPQHLETLKGIRETGERFQKFVIALQGQSEFYRFLIQNYKTSLEKIQKILREFLPEKNSAEKSIASQVKEDGIEIGNRIRENTWKTTLSLGSHRLRQLYITKMWTYTSEEKAQIERHNKKVKKENELDFKSRLQQLKDLAQIWTNTTESTIEIFLANLQKFKEIEASDEQNYLLAQRTIVHLPSEMRKFPGIEKKFLDALKNIAKPVVATDIFTQEEKKKIQSLILEELTNDKSQLNLALEQLERDHMLLEAFVQLGFNFEFQEDNDFRSLFDNVYSVNTLRQIILSWNPEKVEEMPLLQIEDWAFPILEDFEKAIFNKMSQIASERNESTVTPLLQSGYTLVDRAQEQLHLFETAFFTTSKSEKGRDEL